MSSRPRNTPAHGGRGDPDRGTKRDDLVQKHADEEINSLYRSPNGTGGVGSVVVSACLTSRDWLLRPRVVLPVLIIVRVRVGEGAIKSGDDEGFV